MFSQDKGKQTSKVRVRGETGINQAWDQAGQVMTDDINTSAHHKVICALKRWKAGTLGQDQPQQRHPAWVLEGLLELARRAL